MQEHPYTCAFWYPSTAAFEDATLSIQIKAPEIGNTRSFGRNQTLVRMRNGQTKVYDRGQALNDELRLQFRLMPDDEVAAFESFLTTVQWGVTKLRYRDYRGGERVVRIGTTSLTVTDAGPQDRSPHGIAENPPLWNFDLTLLDLTNSQDELLQQDTLVSNQIADHILNFDDPHNPRVTATIGTGAASVIDSVSVDSVDAVVWLIKVCVGANKAVYHLTAAHNGTASGDATTVDYQSTLETRLGTPPVLTCTADLNGAGTAQVMRLKIATDTASSVITVRKVKI